MRDILPAAGGGANLMTRGTEADVPADPSLADLLAAPAARSVSDGSGPRRAAPDYAYDDFDGGVLSAEPDLKPVKGIWIDAYQRENMDFYQADSSLIANVNSDDNGLYHLFANTAR